MSPLNYDNLFSTIKTLVVHHSPSGAEAEVDRWLIARFQELSLEHWQDEAGNIVARIPGRDHQRPIAITTSLVYL